MGVEFWNTAVSLDSMRQGCYDNSSLKERSEAYVEDREKLQKLCSYGMGMTFGY